MAAMIEHRTALQDFDGEPTPREEAAALNARIEGIIDHDLVVTIAARMDADMAVEGIPAESRGTCIEAAHYDYHGKLAIYEYLTTGLLFEALEQLDSKTAVSAD